MGKKEYKPILNYRYNDSSSSRRSKRVSGENLVEVSCTENVGYLTKWTILKFINNKYNKNKILHHVNVCNKYFLLTVNYNMEKIEELLVNIPLSHVLK